MTTPTGIVAEDEAPQRRELIDLLVELWPELRVVAQCEDGLDALDALARLQPRVLFLDIRMPGVSGLEVARAAGPRCHVIFITAYEEYALRAFDAGAVDYLLKPVSRERLARAIERTRERLNTGVVPDVSALIDAVQAKLAPGPRGIRWITASVGNAMKMFAIDEVLFFQAQEKYTRVVAAGSEGFIRTPLKDLLPSLDSDTFWQVHRSVIVRVGAIQAVVKGGDGKLHLTVRGHDAELPVSSAFQYRFRAM